MANEYLMYIATGFYFCCYLPELYANYINKNANIYNLPEKIMLWIGTLFAFTYSVQLGDISFIVNYTLALFIDCVAISMRGYYIIINYRKQVDIQNVIKGLNELEKGMGARSSNSVGSESTSIVRLAPNEKYDHTDSFV